MNLPLSSSRRQQQGASCRECQNKQKDYALRKDSQDVKMIRIGRTFYELIVNAKEQVYGADSPRSSRPEIFFTKCNAGFNYEVQHWMNNLKNTSFGDLNPRHFLGRLLSLSITKAISSPVIVAKPRFFGMYWRTRPCMFSFVPRSHDQCGWAE